MKRTLLSGYLVHGNALADGRIARAPGARGRESWSWNTMRISMRREGEECREEVKSAEERGRGNPE